MRIRITTGWLAMFLGLGIVMALAPVMSQAPLHLTLMSVPLGMLLLAYTARLDRASRFDIDQEWIRPCDKRLSPMRWDEIVDIESSATKGPVLVDRSGHRLAFSPTLQHAEFFLDRAFWYAVHNHMAEVRLPLRAPLGGADLKAAIWVFAGLNVVAFVIAVQRQSIGVALGVLLLDALLLWGWRNRYTEFEVRDDGTYARFAKGRREAFSVIGSGLHVHQGRLLFSIADDQHKVREQRDVRAGDARLTAHLLRAVGKDAPIMEPLVFPEPNQQRKLHRERLYFALRTWILPSAIASLIVYFIAPRLPPGTPPIVEMAGPSSHFVLGLLGFVMALAVARRARQRIRWDAVLLGLVAGTITVLVRTLSPFANGSLLDALHRSALDVLILLGLMHYLERSSKSADEHSSDMMQLGAAWGFVVLAAGPLVTTPFAFLHVLVPLFTASIVSAPLIAGQHAETRPMRTRWIAASLVLGFLLLLRLDVSTASFAERVVFLLPLLLGRERRRRAQLAVRAWGVRIEELVLVTTGSMLTLILFTSTAEGYRSASFLVWVAPFLAWVFTGAADFGGPGRGTDEGKV